MFDLVLPLFIGLALGIAPPAAKEGVTADTGVPGPEAAAPSLAEGSGDHLDASRTPEPQDPTGKFTTATEVRPILDMTKGNWIGVREYEGQDLLYFTHLMAWRCGLWDIRYGINGAPAEEVMAMEPCNTDHAQPNAMIDVENFLPYVAFPLQSIDSVSVEIVYDDGTTDAAEFTRDEVRIP
ncbi:hypothetical protein [Thalassorhabdomicrobium marinisediminis]|uniref:hypothetical protein n=1 Tax=Thalassorhabdomicrobium marinisediminis TaxID=2170577 RepID=UPI0024903C02|nr:hypothetical protein [Thalassorhabdomicrobium marinisediminis]